MIRVWAREQGCGGGSPPSTTSFRTKENGILRAQNVRTSSVRAINAHLAVGAERYSQGRRGTITIPEEDGVNVLRSPRIKLIISSVRELRGPLGIESVSKGPITWITRRYLAGWLGQAR